MDPAVGIGFAAVLQCAEFVIQLARDGTRLTVTNKDLAVSVVDPADRCNDRTRTHAEHLSNGAVGQAVDDLVDGDAALNDAVPQIGRQGEQ